MNNPAAAESRKISPPIIQFMHQELQIVVATPPPSRPVTRAMVYARTVELAAMAGRNSHQFNQGDYERAKRELTGESDFDRQQAILDLAG